MPHATSESPNTTSKTNGTRYAGIAHNKKKLLGMFVPITSHI